MAATRIGFIGAGQMAKALAKGFVDQGRVAAESICATDPSADACDSFQEMVPGSICVSSSAKLVEQSDVVFLAVKPHFVDSVFHELTMVDVTGRLFVSIAAGVNLQKLSRGLRTDRVIRVMPNTPSLVGEGAAAYCAGSGANGADLDHVLQLLSAVGIAFLLPESQLDAVTGLSGSGPAFVYQMIEALSDGGVRVGLPRDVATKLAAQTVLGAAKMVLETGEHPGELKDRVTSPGGTTIAGLHALEHGGMRAALMDAVQAATIRSRELGSE